MLKMFIISLHNIVRAVFHIRKIVLPAVFLDHGSDQRKSVNGHSGEQMMFNLVLKTTAEEVNQPRLSVDVDGSSTLMFDHIVDLIFVLESVTLDIRFLCQQFGLSLVAGCNNPSNQSSSKDGSKEPDLPGKDKKEPGPMEGVSNHFDIVLLAERMDKSNNLPVELESAVQNSEVDVLESSIPDIVLEFGFPEVKIGE
jgi:hypothetical protein